MQNVNRYKPVHGICCLYAGQGDLTTFMRDAAGAPLGSLVVLES